MSTFSKDYNGLADSIITNAVVMPGSIIHKTHKPTDISVYNPIVSGFTHVCILDCSTLRSRIPDGINHTLTASRWVLQQARDVYHVASVF